jgi:hypothetical protein
MYKSTNKEAWKVYNEALEESNKTSDTSIPIEQLTYYKLGRERGFEDCIKVLRTYLYTYPVTEQPEELVDNFVKWMEDLKSQEIP